MNFKKNSKNHEMDPELGHFLKLHTEGCRVYDIQSQIVSSTGKFSYDRIQFQIPGNYAINIFNNEKDVRKVDSKLETMPFATGLFLARKPDRITILKTEEVTLSYSEGGTYEDCKLFGVSIRFYFSGVGINV